MKYEYISILSYLYWLYFLSLVQKSSTEKETTKDEKVYLSGRVQHNVDWFVNDWNENQEILYEQINLFNTILKVLLICSNIFNQQILYHTRSWFTYA